MTSFMEKVQQAKVELGQRDADPLLPLVARAVSGFEAVSTNAILTIVGLRPTTGNARKVARSMRALGYIPIKSRRLPPGGWTDTLCRGWAKTPFRERVTRWSGSTVGQQSFAGDTVRPPTVECER